MLLETEPQEISVSDLAIELADGMPELALSIEHLLSDSKNGQTEGVQGALKNRAHTLRSLLQRSRSFNIELYPRLVYANGACVELLLASGVNNYLEFKALENASVRWGGSIVNVGSSDSRAQSVIEVLIAKLLCVCPFKVPVSKEDISNNSAMSLIEKRTLMKTLKTIVELPKEGPGAPADDVPFSTYLQQQGLSRSIIQVFTDSVSCALELSSDGELDVVSEFIIGFHLILCVRTVSCYSIHKRRGKRYKVLFEIRRTIWPNTFPCSCLRRRQRNGSGF